MQTLEKWPNFTHTEFLDFGQFRHPKLHPSLAAGFREWWGVPSSHASESDPAAQSSNGKKQNNHRFTMAAVFKATAVAAKVRTVMRLERFGKTIWQYRSIQALNLFGIQSAANQKILPVHKRSPFPFRYRPSTARVAHTHFGATLV